MALFTPGHFLLEITRGSMTTYPTASCSLKRATGPLAEGPTLAILALRAIFLEACMRQIYFSSVISPESAVWPSLTMTPSLATFLYGGFASMMTL
jgi:hypothetical protein